MKSFLSVPWGCSGWERLETSNQEKHSVFNSSDWQGKTFWSNRLEQSG